MDIVLIIGGALLALVVGSVLVGLSGKKGRAMMALTQKSHVSIAQAADGELVKLEATIVSAVGGAAQSRVHAQPFVCSEIGLTKHDRRESRLWYVPHHVPFVVEDETGTAVIDIESALVQFHRPRSETVRHDDIEIDGWVREAMEQNGVTFAAGVPVLSISLNEQLIAPGDRVAVMGIARWQDTGDARQLAITAGPKYGVVISAHPNAFD